MQRDTEFITVDSRGVPPAFAAEWRGLMARVPRYSICQGPDYVELGVQKRQTPATVIAVQDGSTLSGLWPLSIGREYGLRVARPAGSGTNEEYSQPLIVSGDVQTARAILDAALNRLKLDSLWLYNVAESDMLASILAEPEYRALIGRHKQIDNWVLTHASQKDLSSHRKGLRYELRRLSKLGTVAFRDCAPGEDTERALRWMFRKKAEWAKERNLEIAWLNDSMIDFMTRLSARVAPDPLVSVLDLNGEPIAAQINHVSKGFLETVIFTYDPQYARYSPGQLIMDYSIGLAQARGLDCDFGFVGLPFKERLSDISPTLNSYEFLLSSRARLFTPVITKAQRLAGKIRRGVRRIICASRGGMGTETKKQP